jgi:Fe-S cluster assembly iron-binding protein IscA
MLVILRDYGERRSLGLIIFTEAAKRRFRTLWPDGLPQEGVPRLDRVGARSGNGAGSELAIYLAEPEEGDETVEHEGRPLLYVSRMVSAAYDGCVVDLVDTQEGVVLAIGPPETHAPRTYSLEDQA